MENKGANLDLEKNGCLRSATNQSLGALSIFCAAPLLCGLCLGDLRFEPGAKWPHRCGAFLVGNISLMALSQDTYIYIYTSHYQNLDMSAISKKYDIDPYQYLSIFTYIPLSL